MRRVLDDGREGLGDVLGDLVSWADGRLEIRTKDDRVVGVEESAMVSGRRIPPPPVRRSAR